MIEKAENILRDLGFFDVRVRHHELGSPSSPPTFSGSQPPSQSRPSTGLHMARIEVGPQEIPKLLADGLSLKVAEALKQIGYAHVTVDLLGYRRGSANEVTNSAGAKQ
jgi:uncharacterized protein